ncbi:MAG TPA: DinB family protein [Vicinamibacterales bacterium]
MPNGASPFVIDSPAGPPLRTPHVARRTFLNGTLEFFGQQRPASPMAWSFLFDIVHHRGQITTYLRPMGSTVPQIYGPSADEPM